MVLAILVLKLGGFPFHFWYIKLIHKLSWEKIWVLSIWQKFLPLFFLIIWRSNIILYLGAINRIMARLRRFKQKKIKKLLGYSSIFTLGWIFTIRRENNLVRFIFLMGYGLNLLFLIRAINIKRNLKSNFLLSDLRLGQLIIFRITLISIRGIPPFLRFFLKLMILKILIFQHFLIALILVVSSIFIIYIYLRIVYINLSLTLGEPMWISKIFKFSSRFLIGLNIFLRFILVNLVYY